MIIMTAQRSTIYSGPEVFAPVASFLRDMSPEPMLLLGIGTEGRRGRRMVNLVSHALDRYGIKYSAFLLDQDGYQEDFKRIQGAVPYDPKTKELVPGARQQTTGTAIILDDFIDTFESGAGANFYTLENMEQLGYTGDVLTIVHYDFMNIAHLYLDMTNRKKVRVGNRDGLVKRLGELGPIEFSKLRKSGAIRHIGRVDGLKDYQSSETDPELDAYPQREKRLGDVLGLRMLKASNKTRRGPIKTHEDFVERIASGE